MRLAERVPDDIELVEPPHVVLIYSFQVRKFAGPGYMCIGDSHRFVDPIFSFGLYIAMKEPGLAIPEVMGWLDGKGRDSHNPFNDYMALPPGAYPVWNSNRTDIESTEKWLVAIDES